MKLKTNDITTLKHGDQLELLLGKYIYKVEFVPPPDPLREKTKLNNVSDNDNESDVQNDIPLKKQKMNETNNEKFIETLKCQKDLWEEIDNGKLLIFTKAGVSCSSKVNIL